MATIKTITGAVAYREKKNSPEWYIVKKKDSNNWELPKSDVRGGESSVSAIIRYMNESLGIKAQVLEEASRTKLTVNLNGAPTEQNLYYYIMRQGKSIPDEFPIKLLISVEGEWVSFAIAKRRIELVREQKALIGANDYFKECQKAKNKKIRRS